jgi:hypothetical protein
MSTSKPIHACKTREELIEGNDFEARRAPLCINANREQESQAKCRRPCPRAFQSGTDHEGQFPAVQKMMEERRMSSPRARIHFRLGSQHIGNWNVRIISSFQLNGSTHRRRRCRTRRYQCLHHLSIDAAVGGLGVFRQFEQSLRGNFPRRPLSVPVPVVDDFPELIPEGEKACERFLGVGAPIRVKRDVLTADVSAWTQRP